MPETSIQPHPKSPLHQANGKFAVGNPGGPGRPPRTQEQEMLATIKATMTPEKIEATIQRALQLAEETKSWRGYLAILEFCASYAIGRPTIRVEQPPNPLDDILAKLRTVYQVQQESGDQ